MEEARRRIKRERKKEKREGENDDGRRKCRTRFRLALLHNFIALSPVFATEKRAKREEGRGGGGTGTLLFVGKNFSRVNVIVEVRYAQN